MKTGPMIIVDVAATTKQEALDLADKLDIQTCRLRVGIELFMAGGLAVVENLRKMGFDIFFDIKFNDDPRVVQNIIRTTANLGVWMVSVQTFGGRAMLEAAMEGASQGSNGRIKPIVVGTTLPSHLIPHDLYEMGLDIGTGLGNNTIQRAVKQLTMLACVSGLDGIICSGSNIASLRQDFAPSFVFVDPGVSLTNSSDIVTPESSIKAGADYLVIGDQITQSADPLIALHKLHMRVFNALRK